MNNVRSVILLNLNICNFLRQNFNYLCISIIFAAAEHKNFIVCNAPVPGYIFVFCTKQNNQKITKDKRNKKLFYYPCTKSLFILFLILKIIIKIDQ